MNQREPSGLPIRAIVMVLLFLGIAFALVGWNATRSSDESDTSESSTVSTVTATTVFYGETPGEHDAANEVGKLLAAPVEQRVPGLAEQPPGVIVAVTG